MCFKRFFFVVLMVACAVMLHAQSVWQVGGGLQVGQSIKNHPDFPEDNPLAYGASVGIYKNLDGGEWWHTFYRFPQLGIEAQWKDPGNNDVFGNVYTATGLMRFELGKEKPNPWMLVASVGFGYLSDPFNIQTNTENIILGTHVNNATQVGVEKKITSLTKSHDIYVGFSMLHLSNAGLHPDNVGINIPQLYLHTYPLSVKNKTEHKEQPKLEYQKAINVGVKLGYGIQQRQAAHGPNYGIYSAQLYATKFLSPINKVSVGVEYVFSESIYDFVLHQEIVTENERWNSSRVAPYIAHELMLGQVSVYASLGYFVHHPVLPLKDISTKLGFQYYFKDVLTSKNQLLVGMYVQSYLGSADYPEVSLGWEF